MTSGNRVVDEHDRQERREGRCACGGTLRTRHWCVAGERWDGNCSLDGGFCALYGDKTCEGFKPYNYCPACGFKEEV